MLSYPHMRKTRVLRFVSLFLVIQTLYASFLPTISYALTSGPTAPEVTSFEPIDTTDMVNLLTGDFTYNIPLLEVPGPAGGYPLSLSYHAGVQPNQDATWAGLGWSLNPGAINRTVNGYPDDHQLITNTNRSYWEGGEQTTYTLGVSVGIANAATVSSGLSFANDTYRGFGVGSYLGIGLSTGFGPGSVGVNVRSTISPYGNSSTSAGIGVGVSIAEKDAMNLGAKASLSVNSISGLQASGGAGVGWKGKGMSGSFLGANISTGGSKPLLSTGGGSVGVHNSNANQVSTVGITSNFDLPVAPGLNIRLGYSYQRYWIDESANVQTNGALYYPSEKLDAEAVDNLAYDTYDLLDVELDMADHAAAEKVLGGSFPNYDQFSVTAQGLAGSIRPYHFQRDLYRQNIKDGEKYHIQNYPLTTIHNPVGFRFVNDFSNRYEYEMDNFTSNAADPLIYDFEGEVKTGENGNDGYVDNKLAGSKHIEWFTNSQILGEDRSKKPFDNGFINTNATGFARESNTQIGGYMITNESGVTYHYSLPVHSYDEYMKSENTRTYKERKGDTYNELRKPEKYAYTWLLTAVTGPDYIDRNNNGLADEGDWGYWVSFDYGKWTDSYQWRNPSEGFNRDLDGEFQNFSTGKKEIYYLDAIRTASHTALFSKKIRKDGKGVPHSKVGGFTPDMNNGESCFYQFPVSVLGLDEIFLFRNEDLSDTNLEELKSTGDNLDFTFKFRWNWNNCSNDFDTPGSEDDLDSSFSAPHFGNNVLDNSDLIDEFRSKSLRIIQLETDYSLSKSTANSMKNEVLYSPNPQVILDGKLTLKALRFLGKGGQSFIPPTTFDYSENNPDYNKDGFDMWGFYKNITADDLETPNENIARLTSDESANYVDAWSLTSINTPLGASINIKYESDWYEKTELTKQQILRIKRVENLNDGNKLKIRFWEDVELSDYFNLDQTTEVDIIGSYHPNLHERLGCTCRIGRFDSDQNPRDAGAGYVPMHFSTENAEIIKIDQKDKSVTIENPSLYEQLARDSFRAKFSAKSDCDDYFCFYKVETKWPDVIVGGVISTVNKPKPGGGLRVKSIEISSTDGSATTNYDYSGGTTSYEPFVILPFLKNPDYQAEPFASSVLFKKSVLNRHYKVIGVARELPGPGVMYSKVEVSEKRKGAGVEEVLPNSSVYEFEVYKRGMVEIESYPIEEEVSTDNRYTNIHFRKLAIKDYSSRVGDLKSISLFDNKDNKRELISKTTNNYLYENLEGTFEENKAEYEQLLEDDYKNQGVVAETFSNARFVFYNKGEIVPYNSTDKASFPTYGPRGISTTSAMAGENDRTRNRSRYFFKNDQNHLLGIVSARETYPSVLVGQTNSNYKTAITTTNKNLNYDFYSGEVVKTLSKDSYGNYYVSEKTPAYQKYDALGLAINGGKNMLTQTASTASYKVDNEQDMISVGLLSASVQTWSDQTEVLNQEKQESIWRKKASYKWNGQEALNEDGTYPYPDFESNLFNFESPEQNSKWEKAGEITLYDIYSHALEAMDINENRAATRLDPSQTKVIASVGNAAYSEFAYSGAEFLSGNTHQEGGVKRGEGSPSTSRSHSGSYSLMVPFNSEGFNYVLKSENSNLAKKYKASVWVYLPGESETANQIAKAQLFYTANGKEYEAHPQLQKNKSKSWYLLELEIDPQGATEVYIGCRNKTSRSVYFDDFRLHPIDGGMTSYVYDQNSGELTHILDGNNIYTHFEYNVMGQLVRTSRERMNFSFGEGKESFRADQVLNEVIYNFGKTKN